MRSHTSKIVNRVWSQAWSVSRVEASEAVRDQILRLGKPTMGGWPHTRVHRIYGPIVREL